MSRSVDLPLSVYNNLFIEVLLYNIYFFNTLLWRRDEGGGRREGELECWGCYK